MSAATHSKRMRISFLHLILVGALLGGGAVGWADAKTDYDYKVEVHFYEFAGSHVLIHPAPEAEELSPDEKSLKLLTNVRITTPSDRHILVLDGESLQGDNTGEAELTETRRVASCVHNAWEGRAFKIDLENQPVQYFAPDASQEKRFELKESKQKTGYFLSFCIETDQEREDGALKLKVGCDFRKVIRRDHVDDVWLNVGFPHIVAIKRNGSANVAVNQWVAVVLSSQHPSSVEPSQAQSCLVMVLRVSKAGAPNPVFEKKGGPVYRIQTTQLALCPEAPGKAPTCDHPFIQELLAALSQVPDPIRGVSKVLDPRTLRKKAYGEPENLWLLNAPRLTLEMGEKRWKYYSRSIDIDLLAALSPLTHTFLSRDREGRGGAISNAKIISGEKSGDISFEGSIWAYHLAPIAHGIIDLHTLFHFQLDENLGFEKGFLKDRMQWEPVMTEFLAQNKVKLRVGTYSPSGGPQFFLLDKSRSIAKVLRGKDGQVGDILVTAHKMPATGDVILTLTMVTDVRVEEGN